MYVLVLITIFYLVEAPIAPSHPFRSQAAKCSEQLINLVQLAEYKWRNPPEEAQTQLDGAKRGQFRATFSRRCARPALPRILPIRAAAKERPSLCKCWHPCRKWGHFWCNLSPKLLIGRLCEQGYCRFGVD